MSRIAPGLLLLAAVAAVPGHAAQDAAADRVTHVVVLQPGDALLPANLVVERAMREALVDSAVAPVTFHRESLGGLENLAIADESKQVAVLREKYAGMRVDLVMVVTSFAVEFVRRHGDVLWPQASVVYFGVGEGTLDPALLPPRFSGVAMPFDLAGTLDLALRLQPRPSRVVYVTGAAPYDQWWTPGFRLAMAHRAPGIPVVEWSGRPLAQLRNELRALPADAIVLYASMFRDEQGERYAPADAVRALAQASAAPVYGVLESYLGAGVVGGSVADLAGHGRDAGMLAGEILNGRARPSAALHRLSELRCRVDARQLDRWQLSSARLPAGCRIEFAGVSPWRTHGGAIAATLIAALLAALWLQSQRRKRIEGEAANAARLAALGHITASVTHEITQPLSAIMSNADAGAMLLARPDASLDEIRQIFDDIRVDNRRACDIIQRVRSLLRERQLQSAPVDLNEIVRSVLSLVRVDAMRRGLVLRPSLDPRLPQIRGDAIHLQQVLLNLIFNAADAMEHLPSGQRFIDVTTARRDAGHVIVSISDVGTGIERSQLPKLFDSFFTTRRKGMGLGLSIARAIIDAHGGEIRAYSNESSGATVTFAIPVERQTSDAPAIAEEGYH